MEITPAAPTVEAGVSAPPPAAPATVPAAHTAAELECSYGTDCRCPGSSVQLHLCAVCQVARLHHMCQGAFEAANQDGLSEVPLGYYCGSCLFENFGVISAGGAPRSNAPMPLQSQQVSGARTPDFVTATGAEDGGEEPGMEVESPPVPKQLQPKRKRGRPAGSRNQKKSAAGTADADRTKDPNNMGKNKVWKTEEVLFVLGERHKPDMAARFRSHGENFTRLWKIISIRFNAQCPADRTRNGDAIKEKYGKVWNAYKDYLSLVAK